MAVSDANANGLRSTASKARRYLFGEKLQSKEKQTPGGMITELQMLRFLSLLQEDMERKHAEQLRRIGAIEEMVKELRSAKDDALDASK